jgi:hypothetical protein
MKLNNIFYMPYPGNKRNEIKQFYEYLNFEGIDTIIEPYAGTSVISYYISSLHPNLKVILNDNNIYIKEIYDIIQDDDKVEEFDNKVNEIKNTITTKDEYMNVINKKDIYAWLIGNKYFNMRPNMCPIGHRSGNTLQKLFKLRDYKIFDFYRNPNVSFTCQDAISVYETYKNNEKCMLILDPPYIAAYNSFYMDDSMNIYEYLNNNNISAEKAKIYLVLENQWIMKLLFKTNNILFQYDKKYELTKRKTSHILISNVK